MQKIKRTIALLSICAMVVGTARMEVLAAEPAILGNITSEVTNLGFVIDTATYNKMCTTVLETRRSYCDGKKMFTQNTRVYICREKNTYNDVILNYVELVPGTYKTNKTTYKSYPESLTVSCKFVNNDVGVQLQTSYPKSSGGKTKRYSLASTASLTGVGITGTVNLEKNALVVRNYSNSAPDENIFKLVYDFQPGIHGYDSYFTDYLQTTTEHLSKVCVKAKKKNYGFCMKFSTNVAKTDGIFILNSSNEMHTIKNERAIFTNFE